MSDQGFNSPSQDDLAIIGKARSHLLKHRLEQHYKSAAKKAGIKPGDKLCGICAKVIKIKSNKAQQFCGVCQGRLDKGETALVTLDRHAFVAPDKLLESMVVSKGSVTVGDVVVTAEQIASIRGKVIGVLPALIDLLELKMKTQEESHAKN